MTALDEHTGDGVPSAVGIGERAVHQDDGGLAHDVSPLAEMN
ncbi:hypothetical protein [Nocardia brasiliensis]|nr:hypothetical protein [Nocardia brasiliensis]